MVNLFTFAYWAAIAFTVIGALLGLAGVWLDNFWRNEVAAKLLITDGILLGASIVVAVITRFLSTSG